MSTRCSSSRTITAPRPGPTVFRCRLGDVATGARGRLTTRSLPIAVVQAERVPVEGAVDVFAASAAGVAADFPQAELLIYPELYLCGLNGRAEERVPGSPGPVALTRSEQLRRARVARRSPWREDVQSPTVQVGPAPRVWA